MSFSIVPSLLRMCTCKLVGHLVAVACLVSPFEGYSSGNVGASNRIRVYFPEWFSIWKETESFSSLCHVYFKVGEHVLPAFIIE